MIFPTAILAQSPNNAYVTLRVWIPYNTMTTIQHQMGTNDIVSVAPVVYGQQDTGSVYWAFRAANVGLAAQPDGLGNRYETWNIEPMRGSFYIDVPDVTHINGGSPQDRYFESAGVVYMRSATESVLECTVSNFQSVDSVKNSQMGMGGQVFIAHAIVQTCIPYDPATAVCAQPGMNCPFQ